MEYAKGRMEEIVVDLFVDIWHNWWEYMDNSQVSSLGLEHTYLAEK
jgi:hypothetical protein